MIAPDAPAVPPETVDESYPASAASVAPARHAVLRWLHALSADALMSGDVGVALSEACTNVVHHAYRNGDSGVFRVFAEIVGDVVFVTVSDDGAGVVPRPDSPGLGLGLPLMAALSDQLDIAMADDGTGTVVCMRFTAAGARRRLAAAG
jgi:serine/threonine-protein kinase RsbW/stage II sporulation protein AB (anti-sigma F factor)